MRSSEQPGSGSEGPQLYRPAKDRGSQLPSWRAIVIILLIVLLGLWLFFRSSRQRKPSLPKQTSKLRVSVVVQHDSCASGLRVPFPPA